MNEYLFVYGTLRPALAPAAMRPVVSRLRPVGRGWAPGRLYDLGPYPAAVFDSEATSHVFGEVLAMPADSALVLRQLDAFEGYDASGASDSSYVRVRQTVTMADGGKLSCWAYHYVGDVGGARLVAGGDYQRRLE